jgi:hypothetical protein
MSIRALIDLDIIKYQVGFASQKQVYIKDAVDYTLSSHPEGTEVSECNTEASEVIQMKIRDAAEHGYEKSYIRTDKIENVLHSVKLTLERIIKGAGATSSTGYVSQGGGFRALLTPDYKANRKDTPKPILIPEIHDYLVKYHNAVVCTDIEADDALGIEQCQSKNTIICTIDKDLDCIPGFHYNWNKMLKYYVTPEEALVNFWCQVLTGDTVDNIHGLKGIGPKKAQKILESTEAKDHKQTVLQAYLDAGRTEEEFNLNCRLIWILRKPLAETYPEVV